MGETRKDDILTFPKAWVALSSRKGLVLVISGLCGLSALIFSLSQPKIYQAKTYLLVSESKIADADARAPNYVYYELLRSYETLIQNDYLVQEMIHAFGLQNPPHSLTVDRFRRDGYLTVSLSKNTRLLEIAVEFPDPGLAMQMANHFVESVVKFNEAMTRGDSQRARSAIQAELEQATLQERNASHDLTEFVRESRLQERREEFWTVSEEKARVENELSVLIVSLSKQMARKSTLESVAERLAGPRLSGGQGQSPAGPRQEDGVASRPLRAAIERDVIELESEIRAAQAGVRTLKERHESLEGRLRVLQREIGPKEATLRRLDELYQQASENRAAQEKRYREAAINALARSTVLKPVAPAIQPERPVRPRVLLNTLLASLSGLLLTTLGTLIAHRLAAVSQRTEEIAPRSEDNLHELKRNLRGL
ncbi:MAG: hypothetical protein AB1898_05935 [Acidobacteriota bacterium]